MTGALDSNVLLYAEGLNGGERVRQARALIEQLIHSDLVISLQALGEVYNVLTRKAGWPRGDAQAAVRRWQARFPVLATTATVMEAALRLATEHSFSIWDAVQLAAAAEARCELLLSEDLQNGFRWQGVTVVNPFAVPAHPLLQALLAGEE